MSWGHEVDHFASGSLNELNKTKQELTAGFASAAFFFSTDCCFREADKQ
jgi:hypothetical protein